MRIFLIGFGVVVLALAANISTGGAQDRYYDNNWCIMDGVHGGGSMDCTYRTFQQCLASRSGNGGTCMANPSQGYERSGRATGRRGRSNQDSGY